jgi:hypothetical protein
MPLSRISIETAGISKKCGEAKNFEWDALWAIDFLPLL